MIKQAKIAIVRISIDQKQDIVQDQSIKIDIIKDNASNQETEKYNEPTIGKIDITQGSNKAPQKHDIIDIRRHIIDAHNCTKRELLNRNECKQIKQIKDLNTEYIFQKT